MGKSTGFMEYERQTSKEVPPLERIKNFNEFHEPLSMEEQRKQAARCMDCGVPFCQYGKMIAGMASGCPLNTSCRSGMIMCIQEIWRWRISASPRRITSRNLQAVSARHSARQHVPVISTEIQSARRKMSGALSKMLTRRAM